MRKRDIHLSKLYNKDFFGDYKERYLIAKGIFIHIFEIFNNVQIEVNSVADFGCGQGAYLKLIYDKYGIDDYVGLDGDYIDHSSLIIPKDRFIAVNLEKSVRLDKKYDLAYSFEVAEHLDAKAAKTFIHSLTEASDIVVFSAAVKYQGGTHHVNEQPQSYWAKIFAKKGYTCFDCFRPLVWSNDSVELVRKQQTLFYIRQGTKLHEAFINKYNPANIDYIDFYHPNLIEIKEKNTGLRRIAGKIAKIMPRALKNEVKRILIKWF